MTPSAESPREILAATARTQRGLFTTGQALKAGLSRRQLFGIARRGETVPVSHNEHQLAGVHRFAGAPDEWPVPVLAAVLAAGGDTVACLDTALQLHGLRDPTPDEIHICRPALWTP